MLLNRPKNKTKLLKTCLFVFYLFLYLPAYSNDQIMLMKKITKDILTLSSMWLPLSQAVPRHRVNVRNWAWPPDNLGWDQRKRCTAPFSCGSTTHKRGHRYLMPCRLGHTQGQCQVQMLWCLATQLLKLFIRTLNLTYLVRKEPELVYESETKFEPDCGRSSTKLGELMGFWRKLPGRHCRMWAAMGCEINFQCIRISI